MRITGLVVLVGLVVCACGGSDGDGDNPGQAGSSGGNAGASGAQAGASGQGGSVASPPACEQLCDRGVELCSVDRAMCMSECAELFAGGACTTEANALLDCQEAITGGTCEDGELVIEGCDTEATALVTCVLEAGPVGGGDGGDGSGGTAGGGPIPSGQAAELIIQSCESYCAGCTTDEDCNDHCRITGVRKDECAREYIDFVDCLGAGCGPLSFASTDRCPDQREALRNCINPSVPGGSLSCTQACDKRLEPGCLEDVRRDICVDSCEGAEAKPECADAVEAYATCAASSRDICLPDGELMTECVEEVRTLQECADLGAPLRLCGECMAAVLATGGVCADELEACGDTFMECFLEDMCLTNCVTFSISDPSGPQTFEACAESCGAGIGDPDPLNFRPVVDCIACNCTEDCARLQAICP